MTFENVGVVGGGTMGNGIAQVLATSGIKVYLFDSNPEALEKGVKTIQGSLQKGVLKGKMAESDREQALKNLQPCKDLSELSPCSLVIEAVIENLEAKIQIFKKLDTLLSADAILASNTSSLSITQMAVSTGRPDKFLGTHFFNPVPLMKLVEVVKGLTTSQETIDRVVPFLENCGKTVVQTGDSPGFIVNRILVPFLNDAVCALGEGIATPLEIDEAMKLGANHPIGPLALCDLIGLDTLLYVIEILHNEFQDPKFRPAPLLRQYVRAGWLGRKTGQGFFKYGE